LQTIENWLSPADLGIRGRVMMFVRELRVLFRFFALMMCGALMSCSSADTSYFDTKGRLDAKAGGARLIQITTPKGKFNVWTKRIGNNPKLKLLLLHGGPGGSHEYFEAFDSFLPAAGIEYYYYDQLGSLNSDHPDDDDLWTTERFVEEVEQVRTALNLGPDNFCLLGHSWGGILAMEYALKYQAKMKCLIVSNMMASIPAYNAYARSTLMPKMDQKQLAAVQAMEANGTTSDPDYMKILTPMHYEQHVLRMPEAQWPEPVKRAFAHTNGHIYSLMQGPSELGASGRLEKWDRFNDLAQIKIPTLILAGQHDTMDPSHMEAMAKKLPKGEIAMMPNGSHMSMYDDQDRYFAALITFLKKQ
jgi:proline iminopeptidase